MKGILVMWPFEGKKLKASKRNINYEETSIGRRASSSQPRLQNVLNSSRPNICWNL